MGEEFSIAFDVAVIAIPLVFAFVGLKRGFAKVVLGLISTVAAFACATALSGPIADAIYGKYVETPIEEQIDSTAGETFSGLVLGDIPEIDFEKVKIDGTLVSEFELNYAGTRKTAVDLSKLDLSETGLTKDDLLKIEIAGETDLANLNAKNAEFSMDDIERYGLGRMAVAQYIAVNLIQQPMMKEFDSLIENVAKYLPSVLVGASSDNKGIPALRTIMLKMLETRDSFKGAVMNGIVRPNCILLIRTIAFGVIFFLVNLALVIAAAATNLVAKMPVIGKVNSLLGCILGLVEGLFVVFVVCLAIRLVVSLTGANSILFNQTAIDSTFLFKWLYNFEFLNFLS